MATEINRLRSRAKRIIIVVANPTVSTTIHRPVGFWASEAFHPYHEFIEVGYEVSFASPAGGKAEIDDLSDPRDPSRYSEHDVLSLGYIHKPGFMDQFSDTRSIDDVSVDDFDALLVAGGQSPMFTFPQATNLHRLIAHFYEAEKVTALLCHGASALLHVKLSDGSMLITGKTMTGYCNSEEDYADNLIGQSLMPFRIEDEAKKLGANFISGGRFRPFAVQDGRLITGQQQYSGRKTAELIIAALGAG